MTRFVTAHTPQKSPTRYDRTERKHYTGDVRKKGIYILLLVAVVVAGAWSVSGKAAPKLSATPPNTEPAILLASTTTPDATLNGIITSWAKQQHFQSSVVVRELTGAKRGASYNQTASFVTASTFKIYVAYAVLHGIEQNDYSLSTITEDGNTIQTDLNNMILNSDDDAARTLGFMVGWKNIDALLKAIGITSTNLYNYVPPSTLPVGDKYTTATDLAAILHKLYAGTLLNRTHTKLLLSLMERQVWRERIPAGVPSSVTVADKPGWLLPGDGDAHLVQNDAAIVYGPKSTYIVVITTSSGTTQPLANLSKLVYNHLEL